MANDWNLSGQYFESCNCETACPCVFLSKPTTGECEVLIAWHIEKGSFEGMSLDGLNVALAVHSPGHMAEVKWKAAVYLDDKANDRQREALKQIFGGHAGGHPAILASHVAEIVGLASAPMEFTIDGKQRRLRIGSFAEVAIEAIEGQGGQDVTITNHPLCIAPGESAVAARSSKLSYKDLGFNWEFSNKNGFYSAFSYQGP